MPSHKPVAKPTPQRAARKAYAEVPRKTKADDPATYTKTPHEYGDILIRPDEKGRTKLGGALQRDLVYWIERNTWGNAKRPEYAKLSLSQLAKLCGSDRRTVARAIADLQQPTEDNPTGRGIIEARDRTGCGPTVAKMYKLTPANWRKAPYYEPATVTEEAIEPEEEAPEESAEIEASADAEATVESGKASKPRPVALSITKDAPAVTIRVVYRSVDLPFPVSFSTRAGRNGRLQINCRVPALHPFAKVSPPESPVTVDDTQLTEYRAFTTEFVLNFWGRALDETLLNQVVKAADGAPVAIFERIVQQKFRRSHTGRNHSTGLLPDLAADAARTHKAEQASEARRTAQRPALAVTADELAEAQEVTPAPEKCPKCHGTGKGRPAWSNRAGVYASRPTVCQPCNGTGSKGGL